MPLVYTRTHIYRLSYIVSETCLLSCQQVGRGSKQFKLQSKLNKNVKTFVMKTFNAAAQICLV